jgi:hypothetical protein
VRTAAGALRPPQYAKSRPRAWGLERGTARPTAPMRATPPVPDCPHVKQKPYIGLLNKIVEWFMFSLSAFQQFICNRHENGFAHLTDS